MFCREQVAQLRDQIDEIRERGAELVIVGSGAQQYAEDFKLSFGLDCPILIDPELRSFRAAGLRRGRVELLSPRLPLNAIRAFRSGARQDGVQGDPWQLGGVFVIQRDDSVTYRHASSEAGDHPPVDDILAALEEDAEPIEDIPRTSRAQVILGNALSRLVDPFIIGSFDRTGYRIHSLTFQPADLDVDLSDKRCVVTGANSGIGYETVLSLADLGAEVMMLCRNVERGEQAAQQIREQTGSKRVAVQQVDMSSLASIRCAAKQLSSAPIDVLVHNAGVLPDERIETEDHLEQTFATHVAGPHLLTSLLRPNLEKSPDARVVWVSSGGMHTRRLNLRDPQWTAREYNGVVAYAETKRAQVVLSEMWAEKLRGSSVVVNAMHPGWADTPSVKSSLPRFHRVTSNILRTPAEGADTVVWLAAAERAREQTGKFFLDRTVRKTHFLPSTRESTDERRALWQLCEQLAEGSQA